MALSILSTDLNLDWWCAVEAEVSRPIVVTGPTTEPITLSEAKKQLEISPSDTAHDVQLATLIQSAREQWEHDTDSVCLSTTLKVYVDAFWDDEIYLPKRPISSITSVKYYDLGNTQQTLSSSLYSLNTGERSIEKTYLAIWPPTIDRWDAIEVTYVAGYSTPALVPAIHKRAMLLLIGKYFENRDMLVNDVIYKDGAYEALVAKFLRSSYP